MFKILFFWTRWLKKLHMLIIRSWVGPFLISFSVILFVLVLQFIAKYTDELFGKGFEAVVIARVFGYACLTLVPLALPLAVLLSSLLTMGNLGERYELAAMKSSGISLFKMIRPLTYGTTLITIGALMFSFYVVPIANLKLYTLLHDLGQVKPSFALKENHFYSDIDGLVIHVSGLDRETDMLYQVKIYDHTDKIGNNRVTIADSGRMVPSELSGYLKMSLFDGVIHEELPREPGDAVLNQYQRFYFDTLQYQVAMAGFDLEESEGSIFAPHHYMKNILDLYESTDSLKSRLDDYTDDLEEYMVKYTHIDTVLPESVQKAFADDSLDYEADGPIAADIGKEVADWFPVVDKEELLTKATQHSRAIKNYSTIIQERLDRESLKVRKFKMEINNRYMLPISCLVFLFLGAPLGAIIRKGGIGLPVIFSILFFIIFYILMIQGRKFARDEIMDVWSGIWLPVLVLTPLAVLFTYSSATDSPILYKQGWWKFKKFILRLLPFIKVKETESNTLSIQELIDLREREKDVARRKLEEYQKGVEEKKKNKQKK